MAFNLKTDDGGGMKMTPGTGEVLEVDAGTFKIVDGSKSTPSMAFGDDPDTGIFSPTNDSVAIVGQGEEILLLEGTASSVNYLKVKSAITGEDVLLAPVGTDANIDIDISAKGSGVVIVDGRTVSIDGTKLDLITVTQGVNLDTIESDTTTNNAKVTNVSTNLTSTPGANDVVMESSDGTNATILEVTQSVAGVLSAADKVRLDGMATGADVTSANETSHANVLEDSDIGGSVQAYDAVLDGTTASYTTANATTLGTALQNVSEDTTPQLGGMLDVNGKSLGDGTLELLSFSETASAVNEITIANAATGNGPTISVTGGDANADLNLDPKGTGSVIIGGTNAGISDTNSNELFLFTATASAVNEITVANAATANNPKFSATGGDTNIGIELITKGTGKVITGALEVTADEAGTASTTTFTNATDTPTSDPGWTSSSTVDMGAPDGYMKAYIGTQAVVIPYWNT